LNKTAIQRQYTLQVLVKGKAAPSQGKALRGQFQEARQILGALDIATWVFISVTASPLGIP